MDLHERFLDKRKQGFQYVMDGLMERADVLRREIAEAQDAQRRDPDSSASGAPEPDDMTDEERREAQKHR